MRAIESNITTVSGFSLLNKFHYSIADICDFKVGRGYILQVLETDEHKLKSLFAFCFHKRNSKRKTKKKKAEQGGGGG